MLSCVYTRTSIDRLGRTWHAQVGKFTCDTCSVEFERKVNAVYLERSTHFCTRACFTLANRTGGAADVARKRTNLERHGVEHPMFGSSTSGYKRRRNATMFKRYGNYCSNEV